ncbi:unnamed protein product [Pseudo-nitzschia multistriata]|uniref:Methyltransferase domain-containing protein n=1 Tax=Pseudo-nitzschia multistriata TaxID=183589 RepID=A0A448ZSW0_9STRA|nr:unnamed protein product [Pseudo-nitzschia multistriata]
MQSDKTIQFWDDYHTENNSLEWISKPGKELLAMISDQLEIEKNEDDNGCGDNDDARGRNKVVSMLEIGCGTSTLVRDVKSYVEERHSGISVVACGSDVSRVCIDTNRKRDCESVDGDYSNKTPGKGESSIWYEVLNILEGEPSRRNWDVIIDKGCLDTFLFRSRQRGAQNRVYPESLRLVLDKIHGWLAATTPVGGSCGGGLDSNRTNSSGTGGKSRFIFITPRSKIKAVRDYSGFSSVRRLPLPPMYRATLESKQCCRINDNTEAGAAFRNDINSSKTIPGKESVLSPGYMFVCTRNDAYQPGVSQVFVSNGSTRGSVPTDDNRCPCCLLTFRDFRKAENVEFRGEAYWTRRWKAHGLHCRGTTAMHA